MKKKVFSKTYILHDKAGMVKPTFVSELEQYVIFTKNKKFFWLKSDQVTTPAKKSSH